MSTYIDRHMTEPKYTKVESYEEPLSHPLPSIYQSYYSDTTGTGSTPCLGKFVAYIGRIKRWVCRETEPTDNLF